jgi:predicted branched-subunit amino acid permease
MDGSGTEIADRSRFSRATQLAAAWRGARETPFIPPFILFATFVGFGALTSQTGLSMLDTVFMSVFIFALPGQVVLVEEMARGASIFTAAIAVAATGVRLLPMTVSLLPMIRDRHVPKWMEFLLAHFVAVTMWLESMRRAPRLPRHLRAAYSLGITTLLVGVSSSGAIIGFLAAANVPTTIAAALLFMMPLYFLLSMLAGARTMTAFMPIISGLLLGPVLHVFFPNFDLILTGLIGGSISFFYARNRSG